MKKKKKNKKSEEELLKTNMDILKIRFYDEDVDAFILENGEYLDLLQIVTKDRENLQDDVVWYDIYNLTRFEKLYALPHKDIGLNFPINTSLQRSNLQRKYKSTADPIRKKWIRREIEELETLDANVERKEFYRMFFAGTKNELIKNRRDILSYIGYGRNKIVKEISKEKKIQIVRKMQNMNTLVLPEEFSIQEEI
ncbi:hypothetical protein [Anaerofustis stercorihominis]|uniref:hypothetical protein n=1 Tax=Anaerofustis stercorihominis TaxID=214853 RepID=UPI0039845C2E